uniref:Autophagy related 2A n=1 Tax=Nothobranchius furzeri TaxID=105023 RepID=A0A8C6L4B2_NOTFU
MSRWLFPWSGSIKKRACRYLLQHYLGHFLQERLSLDQLGLDLYNGSGIIKEINLDVWAVNELLESLGAPLEIVDGFVESIKVAIPWQALLSDHCTLEVSGLQITCQPKYRTNGGWDSQGWSSSMTSSMQLAKECLKDPPEASEEPPAPLEGLEMFAQTIETVLRRIKVTFLDTIVRIEHHPPELRTGVALEVHIKRLEYFDEAVRDPSSQTAVPVDIHQPPAFLHKILQLSAVQLFYDGTGMVRTVVLTLLSVILRSLKTSSSPPSQPLLIGRCSGFMETTIKIKQNDMLPGPKLELDGKVGCVHLLLSPDQITHLTDLLAALCIDTGTASVASNQIKSLLLSRDMCRYTGTVHASEIHSFNTQRAQQHVCVHFNVDLVTVCVCAEMFYSMGPAGMSSSVTSVRSGSEMSDSDMESSTHSLTGLTQPGLANCPRRYPVVGCLPSLPQSGRIRGKISAEQLKPDALMRVTIGGLTLTLLEENPPFKSDGASSLAQVSQTFFERLDSFKDSMFSDKTFNSLRVSFTKACPLSHLSLNKLFILSMTDPVGTYVVNIFSLSSQTQSSELSSSFTLRSPNAVVRLRFPIPDLRPLPKRRPPTQKAVREETLVLELMELELKHQEAPDLQNERAAPGQPWGPCLTQLLEASFTDMHGGSNLGSNRSSSRLIQMVIPADQEEMLQFQEQCVARCQCAVDISLPLAYVLLPSKQAFQSIYNRINNDLLMWEPPPPPPPSAHSPEQSRQSHDEFQLCKSAFRLGELDCSDGKNVIVVLDLLCKINSLCVKMANAGFCEDQTYGEIVLDLEGGKIFSVAQHQNDPNLSFLCLESKRVELYHQAVVKNTPIPERLDMPSFSPPKHLDPTIYPTEVGVSSVSGREGQSQMLSTAIKITLDLDRNVKEFLVALQLQGATIQHYMTQSNQSWHEQLVEFLDVIDDPILGYTPPAIITVLHTHLATCAVDYRPLYLPLRVLFTAESFSLSTNIIVDTATFHLRFILDDSALYLSDKCETDTVDLRRDYVCVLDIDLLELAITTWKGSDTGKLTQPLFELRCSNNVVHLHTCADSCAALINMLQYLISQGDLHPPPRHSSPTEIAGQKLPMSESPASLLPFPPAETAEINQYDLADALIDTEKSSPSVPRGSPVSVYLFPGEASKRIPAGLQREDSDLDGLVPTAMEAQADMMSDEGSEGSTDNDDFCILEAPGMGIPPRDGEPVVTVLSQGPIRVKDSHFSRPRGSSDLLRAPSGFPVPHSRVVLREISVVWHLYGGKDFGSKPMSMHLQSVNRGRSAPAGVRASLSRTATAARPQNSWRWTGGSGRQHTLLMEIQLTKVSFQHESYPVAVVGQDGEGAGPAGVGVLPSGEQPLCRQVFIVQELEVRDRLASSQINKFLYLYTSESMPRRAHSNMLTVKALQVLPESGLGGPECCLRVSLLPLRLNIDQDALFFLKDFFSNLASFVNPYLPVDSAAEGQLLNKCRNISKKKKYIISLLVFDFREFRFTSEVPIWLDYHGKHVVIEQGTFAGILIGLAQLNCSELKLKRLCCRHGLLGVDKVVQYAVTEWQTDITKNQLPGILGGVGPMHSVVQLFHGVRDLFWLPIEQYRKDGRIIRGLQRGAASFGTSTASAALELSNRLVQAIQATAETVYDILSPTPPLSRYAITEGRTPSSRPRRAAQPADLREGVAKAYDTVREGVIDTAQTLCDVASRGHEQKGLPGAVGGVLRQIPPTVVRPLIVASEATSNLLGGMRNQIKPDARKEDFLKWRIEDAQE